MKEFIEKLIGRLKELQKLNYEAYETAQWNNDKIMYINASNAYANAITEVNELAEEYINTSTDTSSDTSTTNANRIRSMTDEELAEFLGGIDHAIDDCEFIVKIGDEWLHDSTADILDWLQSEVKGE